MATTTVPTIDRNTSRLEVSDMSRALRAMSAYVDLGYGPDLATTIRVGAHAIGLGTHEMRVSELAWLEDQARQILA